MRKLLPVFATLLIVAVAAFFVIQKKHTQHKTETSQNLSGNIGSIMPQRPCSRSPQFLRALRIPQPVIIDLSQKKYKGIALLYGNHLEKVLHPKQWEQYGHLSTYAADPEGNLYLLPMPFVSIRPTTFNLQKNIYKLDSKTGKLSIFMHIEDVVPSANNPYGLNAIAYDCDDHTLWVSALDESDYRREKGVIYHIDPKKKEILQRLEGVDALSVAVAKSTQGKYLLIGSARDNGLYAYPIKKGNLGSKGLKLLTLPNVNEHIRKIKVIARDRLELQSIPFSYTLIAQSGKKDRTIYDVHWDTKEEKWQIDRK